MSSTEIPKSMLWKLHGLVSHVCPMPYESAPAATWIDPAGDSREYVGLRVWRQASEWECFNDFSFGGTKDGPRVGKYPATYECLCILGKVEGGWLANVQALVPTTRTETWGPVNKRVYAACPVPCAYEDCLLIKFNSIHCGQATFKVVTPGSRCGKVYTLEQGPDDNSDPQCNATAWMIDYWGDEEAPKPTCDPNSLVITRDVYVRIMQAHIENMVADNPTARPGDVPAAPKKKRRLAPTLESHSCKRRRHVQRRLDFAQPSKAEAVRRVEKRLEKELFVLTGVKKQFGPEIRIVEVVKESESESSTEESSSD